MPAKNHIPKNEKNIFYLTNDMCAIKSHIKLWKFIFFGYTTDTYNTFFYSSVVVFVIPFSDGVAVHKTFWFCNFLTCGIILCVNVVCFDT